MLVIPNQGITTRYNPQEALPCAVITCIIDPFMTASSIENA